MKKLITLIAVFSIVFGSICAFDNTTTKHSSNDATQFAEKLKALDGEVENRLIVGADKSIDYRNADGAATGIEGLYVLQFPDADSAKTAYEYYEVLPYVRYVEYDSADNFSLCSVEGGYDFTPDCSSTVTSNIDDAIKLIDKVKGNNLPEIKVGVLDSGIAKTNITRSRLDGGYSYFEGKNADGTSDSLGHGTKVAGTIIQNTLENVRLYSYQVMVTGTSSETSVSRIVSAIYLAASDGCRVISCSFGYGTGGDAISQAVSDVADNGTIVVAAAGNDSISNVTEYPAACEKSISVGATDTNRRLASFSNYGSLVDIYATGRGLTSWNTYGVVVDNWQGTSAATPVISSICALLLEVKPDITVDEIKSLLVETGIATNEDEMTEVHRYVADAYECVKTLTGQELEKTDLQFEQSGNTIAYHSNDENASVFYCNNSGSVLQIAYKDLFASNWYAASLGEEKTLRYYVITATAYAPGKAKSKTELLKAPIYNYEYGYLINEANDTQQYNKFSRCEIIDETVMVVPETINGIEVQEIGDYCYMGNQTVETIILPDTVKQIDAYAFANCPNLKKVIAPGVEYCGRYAFYDCPNLRYVEMPLVTLANTAMFKNCTSLSCLDIGELTTICNHAFKNCSIDLNDTAHHYEAVGYESVENDTMITLRCSKCGEEMQVSFAEHLNTDYPLLDLNDDSIVNAKDFAIIINEV